MLFNTIMWFLPYMSTYFQLFASSSINVCLHFHCVQINFFKETYCMLSLWLKYLWMLHRCHGNQKREAVICISTRLLSKEVSFPLQAVHLQESFRKDAISIEKKLIGCQVRISYSKLHKSFLFKCRGILVKKKKTTMKKKKRESVHCQRLQFISNCSLFYSYCMKEFVYFHIVVLSFIIQDSEEGNVKKTE